MGDREALDTEVVEIINRGGDSIAKIIEEKKQTLGEDEWYKTLKRVVLQSIDTFWVDHLETMDYTRSSVNLRAYGQRDPLVEYRREALNLFKYLKEAIYEQIINVLPNVGAGAFLKAEQKLRESVKLAQITSGKNEAESSTPQPGHSEQKIGRNDKVILVKDGKEIEVKFKKVEEYVSQGWKIK